MYISEWVESGHPENVWFVIMRHEELNCATSNTPYCLARLIELCLQSYGDFEIRRWESVHSHFIFPNGYWTFEDKFIAIETTGIVNGEKVPVLAMIAETRIIKLKDNYAKS